MPTSLRPTRMISSRGSLGEVAVGVAFHDTDIPTRILADISDTLKLFLWQAEQHADIFATILSKDVGVVECGLM